MMLSVFLFVAANLGALRYHAKYVGLLMTGFFNESQTHPPKNNQFHKTLSKVPLPIRLKKKLWLNKHKMYHFIPF